MAQNQPLWLQLVHRLERAVGTQVESAVRTDKYFDLVTQATRARTRLQRATETVTQEWLHLWNLPAGSDVRRLREQIARLERGMAELAKELSDRDGDGDLDRDRDGGGAPPTPSS